MHEILKKLGERNLLPACPSTLIRLAAELRNETGGSDKLSRVIASDPALTAELLKTSNSAFFGAPRVIRSVPEAILLLGQNEIRKIMLFLQGKYIFNSSATLSLKVLRASIWAHALRTAVVARCIGEKLKSRDPDIYYTAAILHDIGKIILLAHDPKYGELLAQSGMHGARLVQCEEERYQTHHALLGGELLANWRLPEVFAQLVANHHAEVPLHDPQWNVHKLLSVSNAIAHLLEDSQNPLEQDFESVTPMLAGFAVTVEVLHGLRPAFEQEFTALKNS